MLRNLDPIIFSKVEFDLKPYNRPYYEVTSINTWATKINV